MQAHIAGQSPAEILAELTFLLDLLHGIPARGRSLIPVLTGLNVE